MDFSRVMRLIFWVAISQCFFCSCFGYKFYVGGKDGWTLEPSEDYSHWSHRNRFLVNDTLYFKYKQGEDSVLEVTKDDYYNCNTSNWVFKSDNGSSEFKLARSGPFFFISGVKDHCDKGQKLLLIVLSEKHRRAAPAPTVHPPSVSPSPLSSASHQPPATAPSRSPLASSPATTAHSPASAPSSSQPPAVSPDSSQPPPSPSTLAPSGATPPGGPAADAPPTQVPVPSPKAAASGITSGLPISIALMVGSSLFFGVL